MGTPITRLGDVTTGHSCFPPTASSAGSGTVFVNGIPVIRVGDPYTPHACPNTPPHPVALASGSGTVFADGIPIGRQGDPLSCGDTVSAHSPDVFAE